VDGALAALLGRHKLGHLEGSLVRSLGVADLEDLALLEEADLAEIPRLKPVHRRRLLRALAEAKAEAAAAAKADKAGRRAARDFTAEQERLI
jgi:hypothetical protein